MPVNYQKQMEAEVARVDARGEKPTLLLHACCAPCSSAVLEYLCAHFTVTLFFYNPNIYPESEFAFRLDELKRLPPLMGLPPLEVVAPAYDPAEFDAIAAGLEELPEGGARCAKCYRLRLERAVRYAAERGFDYVTTTLSVSPHKNAVWLNTIGEELGAAYGARYLVSDFKKKDGYKRSCELSRRFELYRQNYCGCVYSKRLAENREEMFMTETQKMLAGKLYDPTDEALAAQRTKAHRLSKDYNDTYDDEAKKREVILKELLPHTGERLFLQGPIRFDYGVYTSFGDNCYANFNFTVLDSCPVTIGNDVFFGPNCSLMTPIHPLLASERNMRFREDGSPYDLEYAAPITIGDGCWIASGVTVCGGVTIGKNCVIGAGSVVTRDIPDGVFAAGNPCRVIRPITEQDSVSLKTALW